MSYDNSSPTLNYFCKFPNFPPASETGLKLASAGGFRAKNRARGRCDFRFSGTMNKQPFICYILYKKV